MPELLRIQAGLAGAAGREDDTSRSCFAPSLVASPRCSDWELRAANDLAACIAGQLEAARVAFIGFWANSPMAWRTRTSQSRTFLAGLAGESRRGPLDEPDAQEDADRDPCGLPRVESRPSPGSNQDVSLQPGSAGKYCLRCRLRRKLKSDRFVAQAIPPHGLEVIMLATDRAESA